MNAKHESKIKLDMRHYLCGAACVATFTCQADDINLYSLNTGSYVYHLTHNHGQYTEHFDNKFISVERKFSEQSDYSYILGTMNNSFNDRCLAAGVRKDWANLGDGLVFKGIYGYVGEFFFDAFSDCGDHGSYHDFKKVTGVGFSPYIYHGFQYNFTSYFGMDVGLIIPSVFVITVQWSFR